MAQMKIRLNTQAMDDSLTHVQVASANKDGVAGTPSMRTLGSGAQQAMAGNTRLDQITTPTASVGLGSQRIINLADPVGAQDAATKNYVDSISQGVDWKASVRAATTGNITLSGTQTIDGVALSAGDRVLVKDQSSGSANGIYAVAAGAWSRSADADVSSEVTAGLAVFVEEGTVNADTGWILTTNGPIVLNTTALTFTQFTALGSVTAGAGLTKTGSTIDVGAGDGIQVNSDSVEVKLNGTTIQKSASGVRVNPNLSVTTITVDNGAENAQALCNSGRFSAALESSDGIHTFIKSGFTNSLNTPTITSARSWTLPDATGTILLKESWNRETPSGTLNGTNRSFTLARSYTFLLVLKNGQLLLPGAGNDYSVSGTALTIDAAAPAPESTDNLQAIGF